MLKATITLKFGATVPIMDYGNFSVEATWTGEANPAEAGDLLTELRLTVANQVLHVVEAQIKRAVAYGKMQHVNDPEKFLMVESKPFYWLRTVAPELNIPSLEKVTQRPAGEQPAQRASAEDQTCEACGRVLNGKGECFNANCKLSPLYASDVLGEFKEPPNVLPLDEVNAALEKLTGIKPSAPAAPPPPEPPAKPKGSSRLNQPRQNRIGTKGKEKSNHANR